MRVGVIQEQLFNALAAKRLSAGIEAVAEAVSIKQQAVIGLELKGRYFQFRITEVAEGRSGRLQGEDLVAPFHQGSHMTGVDINHHQAGRIDDAIKQGGRKIVIEFARALCKKL